LDALSNHTSPPSLPWRAQGLLVALLLLQVAIAALGSLLGSYRALGALVVILVLVNASILLVTGLCALRTRQPGPVLLSAGCLAFFWLEAASAAGRRSAFAPPDGVDIVAGDFGLRLVQQALLYLCLFQVGTVAGYALGRRPLWPKALVRGREDKRSAFGRALVVVSVLCSWFPLLFSYNFSLDVALQALVASRRPDGTSPFTEVSFVNYLNFVGMFGAAYLLCCAVLSRGGWRTKAGLWAIAATACLPSIMFWGTRHLWLFVAMPACLGAARRAVDSLTPARLTRLAVVAAAALMVVQLQFALRDKGWDAIASLEPASLLHTETTGQFDALLYAEYLVPGQHPYFVELPELYFLIHPIPRSVWPTKPVMESWTYYNAMYTNGATSFNVTPSIVGQFHMIAGVFGVLWAGLLLGYLTGLSDSALLALDLESQWVLLVSVGMFYAFLVSSFRFYSPVYFTYFAVAAALAGLASRNALATSTRQSRGQVLARAASL
jgi:hypothetical protein